MESCKEVDYKKEYANSISEINRLKEELEVYKETLATYYNKPPKIMQVIERNLRVDIAELKMQLAEKDKEIANIRHQVCEEIRDWYREQDLIIEVWLKDCLDQIEGEGE